MWTDSTRARTISVPIMHTAWVGLDTLQRSPMNAELASWRILAVIPTSLEMMAATRVMEVSADCNSCISSS